METIIQTPSLPENWLYMDCGEERIFTKSVSRNAETPAWLECTDAQKSDWEEQHLPEEQDDVQEEQQQ